MKVFCLYSRLVRDANEVALELRRRGFEAQPLNGLMGSRLFVTAHGSDYVSALKKIDRAIAAIDPGAIEIDHGIVEP